MVGQSQMRRYCLHLTEQEMADLIWAAHEGADQVFGYTDHTADFAMELAEFQAWEHRVAKAIALLEAAAQEGVVLP
jgi:hypothetical protein